MLGSWINIHIKTNLLLKLLSFNQTMSKTGSKGLSKTLPQHQKVWIWSFRELKRPLKTP